MTRDKLGVKPLYWAEVDGKKVFVENVNELFERKGVPRRLRKELLGEYFAQGWICEPDTIWVGVYKVPTGGWQGECGSLPLEDAIRASVREACRGKVCNLFSGGIDSSLIAAYARDEGLEHLHITLGDRESERVVAMEKAFRLNVTRFAPPKNLVKEYPRLVRAVGEPIADPGIISCWWMGTEAKARGYEAIISGMGGDEIDAGYPRNRIVAKLFGCWPVRIFGTWMLKPFGWMMMVGSGLLHGKRRRDMRRLGSFLKHPDPSHYFNLFGYFTKEEIDQIAGGDWFSTYDKKVRRLTADEKGVKRFFAYEYKGFLASHNNLYGALSSRIAGVECRMPLLKPEIAAMLYPDIEKNAGKKRLTALLKKELGPIWAEVKKSGFRFPIENCLRNVPWDDVRQKVQAMGVSETGLKLFDGYVSQLFAGNVDEVYMKLWAFYTLALLEC